MMTKGVLVAHVEATAEIAHSNGPEGHKCNVMHGHSMLIEMEWQYAPTDLNEYGWGVDFGQAKALIHSLDHQNLNYLFSFAPSAENIAAFLYNEFQNTFGHNPTLVVRVHEGRGNAVTYKETA